MTIKVKVPTENTESAQGIKIYINDVEIPFISRILIMKDCNCTVTDLGNGLHEINCGGIQICEDTEISSDGKFKILRIMNIKPFGEE